MNIGVFDSGIGGKFIADKLYADFPEDQILYVDDHEHVPYGNRSPEEVTRLTEASIQPLFTANCDVIVLACNTATAAAIEYLRKAYPKTPFVGLEPMVKPAAALTQTGVIAVCATPATLASTRYDALKKEYATGITILDPDCSSWANMIEHNEIDDDIISNTINNACNNGADVIVLACTHYHWIKEKITEVADNRAVVIDPSDSISKRVRSILYAQSSSDKKVEQPMNNSDDGTTPASILGVNNPSIQYTDRPTAKALIFNDQNEVLIINDGLLPGGGVEKGEDALAALQREVLEELGINIKNAQELGKVVQYRDFLQKKYSINGYTALYDGDSYQTSPQDSGEAAFSYKWYSIHDALKLLDQSISQAKEAPVQTNDTFQGKLYNLETTKVLLQIVQL